MAPMSANFFELFGDPVRRRRWLLVKALEYAPLAEALMLAKATESFLTGCQEAPKQEAARRAPSTVQRSMRIH
jgi:hypothetical protein